MDRQVGVNSIPSRGDRYSMSGVIRLYPATYTGDIQAINAGSPDVHMEVQGRWLRTTMSTKHKYICKKKPN